MIQKNMSLDAALKLAQKNCQTGKPHHAIPICKQILKQLPTHKATRNLLALSYFGCGQIDDALKLMSLLNAQYPHDLDCLTNYCRMMRLSKRFSALLDALSTFTGLTFTGQSKDEILSCLSQYAQQVEEQDNLETAVKIYDAMATIAPDNLFIFLKRARYAPEKSPAISDFLLENPVQSYHRARPSTTFDLGILYDPESVECSLHPDGLLLSNGHVETRHMSSGAPFHIKGYFISKRNRVDEKLQSDTRIVLNAISDPDLSRDTLKHAEKMLENYPHPVLNKPEHVLDTRRDKSYEKLKDIKGLFFPKTRHLKVQPDLYEDVLSLLTQEYFVYPLILRPAGSQGGIGMKYVADNEELKRYISNSTARYLYITQFYDYQSHDGLYRKQRVFYMGDEIIPMHKLVHTDWMVHARAREETMYGASKYMNEEIDFVQSKIEGPVFKKIKEEVQLDIFGMDYAQLSDGRLLVFEVNACMHSFPHTDLVEKYPELGLPSEKQKEAFIKLVTEKVI